MDFHIWLNSIVHSNSLEVLFTENRLALLISAINQWDCKIDAIWYFGLTFHLRKNERTFLKCFCFYRLLLKRKMRCCSQSQGSLSVDGLWCWSIYLTSLPLIACVSSVGLTKWALLGIIFDFLVIFNLGSANQHFMPHPFQFQNGFEVHCQKWTPRPYIDSTGKSGPW